MRTRTSLLVVIIATMLASAVGTLVAVGVTAGTAHACSIAPPWAEVTPAEGLLPGDSFVLSGFGFNNILPGDGDPPPQGDEPQIAYCDFVFEPMSALGVSWHGASNVKLGVVEGPEFTATFQVPADAEPGAASILIGDVAWVDVYVGPIIIDPPHPCPLVAQPDGTVQHDCPWPCPIPASNEPARSDAPQPLPPCFEPEPCILNFDGGPADGIAVYPDPKCPPPCEVVGGDAVWCPPDCEVYVQDAVAPCPPPCEAFIQGAAESPPAELLVVPPPCPPYCEVYIQDAVAPCPPPPCDVFIQGAVETRPAEPVVLPPPCPPYCEVYIQDAVAPCPPPPCEVYIQDAIETRPAEPVVLPPPCPEPPCELVGGDAYWCPEPCLSHLEDLDPQATTIDPVLPCPEPCGDQDNADAWCPTPCDVFIQGPPEAQPCPAPCSSVVRGASANCPDICPVLDVAHERCPAPCDVLIQGPSEVRPCGEPCSSVVRGASANCPDICPVLDVADERCPQPCTFVSEDGVVCPAVDPAVAEVPEPIDPAAPVDDLAEPPAPPVAVTPTSPSTDAYVAQTQIVIEKSLARALKWRELLQSLHR